MTQITREAVEHVAKLARLQLSDEEVLRYTQDLSGIIELVEKLNGLALEGVQVDVSRDEMPTFREDKVSHRVEIRSLLENAPGTEETFFRVPKILDEG